jgi:hypothetical protein
MAAKKVTTRKTNHIQFFGTIYCRKQDAITEMVGDFIQRNCVRCEFLSGSNQGIGIECYYEDGSNKSFVHETAVMMRDDIRKWFEYHPAELHLKLKRD